MRLLFDEQLSEMLCDLLQDKFPDSLHVRRVADSGSSDEAVWDLAKSHNCVLVTKDEDFVRMSVLRGAPPKRQYGRRSRWGSSCFARYKAPKGWSRTSPGGLRGA